ncbi:hypothetical protein B0A50_01171 [Salinomyces thailandicus]|uniref:A-kinase anchor protein 7-like phosphoesterase domain-containing protein n=1 Tax=Salinomyces thailandicus TaxID=706561 RepID=A0A4U0UEW5_9PEZI|nr:hypothetical protein B0A50_01171 [Salinomyces thailandica]
MARYRNKSGPKSTASKKPPLTHFLCLPLVTSESGPKLEASSQRFKDIVATKEPAADDSLQRGGDDDGPEPGTSLPVVHPEAIRPVGALHCTLGVMSLDQSRLKEAKELLENLDIASMLRSCQSTEQGNRLNYEASSEENVDERPTDPGTQASASRSERIASPLSVDLKGLVSMHSPTKTSILYSAPIDSTERLYPFCLALQKLFSDKGFLVSDDRQLKLHATIVNTIYAKGRKRRSPPKWKAKQETPEPEQAAPSAAGVGKPVAGTDSPGTVEIKDERPGEQDEPQGHGPNANAPLKMDATAILERFKDFVWAEDVVLDRIAICEMGAKKKFDGQGRVVAEEYTEVASVRLPT